MSPRAFYLVICDHEDGPIIRETRVANMDFATVRRQIDKQQIEKPVRVIEFIPVRGTCRDASHEFLNPLTEP
jgi:hypothetical protein